MYLKSVKRPKQGASLLPRCLLSILVCAEHHSVRNEDTVYLMYNMVFPLANQMQEAIVERGTMSAFRLQRPRPESPEAMNTR